MRLSTSHKLTTSTGATCTSRSKSLLPYQPVPIRPTRGLRCANSSTYPRDFVYSAVVNANPLPDCRNSRRFMDGLLEKWVRTRRAGGARKTPAREGAGVPRISSFQLVAIATAKSRKNLLRRLPLVPSADGSQAYDTWAILPSAADESMR